MKWLLWIMTQSERNSSRKYEILSTES